MQLPLIIFKFRARAAVSVLTEGELLARVRRQRESEHRHGRDEHAGDDEVEEVVEGPAPDLDHERHVQVRLGAAVVEHLVALARNAYKR